MAHRLSPQAEAELDEIWHYIATESGSRLKSKHNRSVIEEVDGFDESSAADFNDVDFLPFVRSRG
jgi:hypothetical protein